ncbi:MAG: alpha/beta hydrolase [Planctomycetota bacterium]|nr:alpha/beta hydrolase [Planctomycetota bacterium]
MSGRFFEGESGALFGFFQPATGGVEDSNPILICPPVGHEYFRTHWCLRRTATVLSRKSNSVFRFDYRGSGDSAGKPGSVQTIEDWMFDAHLAAEELADLCGVKKLDVIGLRTGGIPAAALAGTGRVRRLILWEPQIDAGTFVKQWRRMHRTMLDLWVTRIQTPDNGETEELLGTMPAA